MAKFKVWFITGCSSRFGKTLALEVLGRGDKVIASARNAIELEDLKKVGAVKMSLDVTLPLNDLRKLAKEAHEHYGKIDYLINDAGYCQVGGLEERTRDTSSICNQCTWPTECDKIDTPLHASQRAGVIVNFSSIGAWCGTPAVGLYEASKWAVSGLTETLHLKLAELNIKVGSIEPGYFQSNFLSTDHKIVRKQHIPEYDATIVRQTEGRVEKTNLKQPGDPVKRAKVIVDVLSGVTGREIQVRVALGADANMIIKGKCEETIKLLNEWKDVTSSTDVDHMEGVTVLAH